MDFKSFFTSIKIARVKAMWPTVASGLILIFYSYYFETTQVDYSHFDIREKSVILGIVYRLLLLETLLLGIFTFPRWYSSLALASVAWVLLCAMGR